MIPNGYTLVVDTDGCRHRRYVRWDEVKPAARLPEQFWRFRWPPEGRCAVAVPDRPYGRDRRFHPCGRRQSPGVDLCDIHVRKERHPQHRHVPGDSE